MIRSGLFAVARALCKQKTHALTENSAARENSDRKNSVYNRTLWLRSISIFFAPTFTTAKFNTALVFK
jgi:hypothetical protein